MKLIAEQVKYLREKREELLRKSEEFAKYLSTGRECDSINEGTPFYADYSENQEYHRGIKELKEIDRTLEHSEIITDRNFDMIDIGTAFYAKFVGEDEKERLTLVESGASMGHSSHLVSLDSDFGRAVHGHKDGDMVVYTVSSTGRQLGVSIEEIDRIKKNYCHFINEVEFGTRISSSAKAKLRDLKIHEPEEYERYFTVSASQKELIKEELIRNRELSSVKRSYLTRVLDSVTAKLPEDGSIGIGSHVQVLLVDENNEATVKDFEYINRAFSTELEDHYVERISSLGNVLYGLKTGDTFKVPRKNKKSLKGTVLSVENEKEKAKQRVR